MQEQCNEIDRRKCDTVNFLADLQRVELNIRQIKIDVDNHGNHFAMVENFVEKYIPIRI